MSYPDKISPDFSQRNALSGVDSWLSERWSPRSFVKTDIADNDVETLFDAARWAPSCFNDQPWQFHVRKQFDQNGKPNPYAEFDAGAAWMALSLQVRKMGLYTHGMGGIKHDEVASYLKLDDNHKVICGIAIGVADEPSALPDDIAKREKPSPHKPLADVLIR